MRVMKQLSVSVLVCVLASVEAYAQSPDDRLPGSSQWVSTFSIIAFDPDTGQLGVGVQSRAFAAGAIVPWAKAGVGAVATQAAANRSYGPKAIALLEQGLSPAEVVKKITDDDPGRDRRQVAVIDARGRSAAYTGKHVIDRNSDPKDRVHLGGWAGSRQSVNFSVQGNTLASEAVVNAMTDAYAHSSGSTMAERLMDALDAGQSKGGDIRGMQAAGILVVQPITDPEVTTDHLIDIRVDDAVDPFKELRRVLNVRLSGDRMQRAKELAKKGKLIEALEEQQHAVSMNPKNELMQFALAERYADAGEYLKALNTLQQAIAVQPYLKLEAMESASFSKMQDSVDFRQLVAK
jgi:uncharacterized Ntn-hydrolase superfamily protein